MPAIATPASKREREEVPLVDAKRHKRVSEPTPKREPDVRDTHATRVITNFTPSSLLELDAVASVAEHSRIPAQRGSPSTASTGSLEEAAEGLDEANESEQGDTIDANAEDRYAHETASEKRDRLMAQWRDAVAPEVLDATTLSTIPECHDRTRGRYQAAQSADVRLAVIRRHRERMFKMTVYQLRKNRYVDFPTPFADT
jgi:hypothetical protein